MFKGMIFNERGGVLFAVALSTVAMVMMGVTAFYLANTEVTASGAKFEKAKALYLAQAGLHRAIVEMTNGMDDGWQDEIAGADGTTGTSDDGILAFGPSVDCTPFQSGYSTGESDEVSSSYWNRYLGHYDVRIEDGRRPGEQSGDCNKAILGSVGVSSKDFSTRVEAEIEVFELPPPPSLVFMIGRYNETVFPDPFFAGQSWWIGGEDRNLDDTGGPTVGKPGIGTNGVAQGIVDALNDNQKDQVSGIGYDPAASPPIPSVQHVDTQVNLREIAYKLKSMADNIVPPGTYATFTGYGSPTDYQITVCDGDLHLSGDIEGYGTLVITGDFKMSGQGKWVGYIICLNHARFTGGGTQFHLYGTLMIGNSSGLDLLAEFEITGNADLLYSSEAIEKTRLAVKTVAIKSWRRMAAN
ncbi:MAG: hypothetical protein JSV84_16150 [Gemmatimonadota bacterium]|nr:MAG: hypothetical protein JSV84_16150 [Gemmatimonadota bacterium]